MLRTYKNLFNLQPAGVFFMRYEGGIPSIKETKKSDDDYHPSKYTILGNKRVDPMHYTDRKVGRGYWHFSNVVFHSRPKIHPKSVKGIKRNLYIIFGLLFGMCIDYNWLGHQIKELTINFRPEAADCNSRDTENVDLYQSNRIIMSTANRSDKENKKSYRRRRIIKYENRLRKCSSPEKIFRYFAALKAKTLNDGTSRIFKIYITHEDFVRPLTSGLMQPHGLGHNKFITYEPDVIRILVLVQFLHHYMDAGDLLDKVIEVPARIKLKGRPFEGAKIKNSNQCKQQPTEVCFLGGLTKQTTCKGEGCRHVRQ
uniref:Uncharacterized protein n=1 Tax=Setaria digitata TaxID=48799 RepID=A0A915PCD0_9BILA